MKKILTTGLICFSISIMAQDAWQSLKLVKMPEMYKTSSIFYRIGVYQASGASDAWEKVRQQQIVTREDRRIYTEVVYGDDLNQPINTQVLIDAGLEIQNVWKNRASCWIDIGDILRISSSLPEHYLLMPVRFPTVADEGPGVMNSDSYIDNGADGSGIYVAIIDIGFRLLSEAVFGGYLPLFFIPFDWTGTGLETGVEHGTACFETVYDHAPAAAFQIHKTYNTTDLGNAVDVAIASGVDIISHSLGYYNTGWDDNSGPACAAVEDAANAGILFFTAAGNDQGGHWQGYFDDDDDDNWHEWSGADEKNNGLVLNGDMVEILMQWDGGEIIDYYDLFLYDASTDVLLESSTSIFTFEDLVWENSTGSDVSVYIKVQHNSPWGTPEFEVSNYNNIMGLEYYSEYGSTISPSNSTEPNCISVGAVDFADYGALPGDEVIENFSSHGPTNGGNQAPDIVAPDQTTTFAYGGAFSGTSGATPNAAGATAAFWSGHSYLSATGVRHILLKKSSLYNDWGDAGTDYIYGNGGLELYDYSSPTRYIDKDAGNTEGDPDEPYFNMQQANNSAPNNALIVFLGGQYNAVSGYIFDRPLVYRSLIEDSTVR